MCSEISLHLDVEKVSTIERRPLQRALSKIGLFCPKTPP